MGGQAGNARWTQDRHRRGGHAPRRAHGGGSRLGGAAPGHSVVRGDPIRLRAAAGVAAPLRRRGERRGGGRQQLRRWPGAPSRRRGRGRGRGAAPEAAGAPRAQVRSRGRRGGRPRCAVGGGHSLPEVRGRPGGGDTDAARSSPLRRQGPHRRHEPDQGAAGDRPRAGRGPSAGPPHPGAGRCLRPAAARPCARRGHSGGQEVASRARGPLAGSQRRDQRARRRDRASLRPGRSRSAGRAGRRPRSVCLWPTTSSVLRTL